MLGGDSGVLSWLLRWNTFAVLAVVVAAFLVAYLWRMSWISSSVLASLSFLLVYKVGHPQFYVFWLVLLVGLLIEGSQRSRMLAYWCLLYAIFLSVFQFGYVATFGYHKLGGGWVRDNVGFIANTIGLVTIAGYLAIHNLGYRYRRARQVTVRT